MSTYNYNIQLQDIHIQNFRGFGDVDIHFDEKLTVFIGINGSGKTSILELLADMLRQYIYRANQTFRIDKTNSLNNILQSYINAENDIRIPKDKKEIINKSDSLLKCSLLYWKYDEDRTLFANNELCLLEYNLEKKKPISFNISTENNENDTEIQRYGDFIADELMLKNGITDISIPVVAFYPCQSLTSKHDNEKILEVSEHILGTYDNLFEQSNINFKQLKKWFEWRQKLYLQLKEEDVENQEDITIKQIYSNILAMLNDEDNTYTRIYIDWRNKSEGEFVLVKNGAELRENQFSSGEKMLFTLVADISAKMAVANPTSPNPSKDGVGVVLIDEIDLHLHPKWQRKVIGKLQEIFPKVQFVVTTHSPEVLKEIDRKHLRIIKNGKVINNVPYIKGRDTNSILEDVFEHSERPAEYQEKLDNFYRILEGDKAKAEKILTELKEDWGEMDSEIVRATSYLEIY